MFESRRHLFAIALAFLVGALFLSWPAISGIVTMPTSSSVLAQQQCQEIADPKNIPSAALINFDSLPNASVIGDSYLSSFGVSFENSPTTRALIYGNEPALAHSSPNVAINDALPPNTSAGVPMRITFDNVKTHVGFYIGNGDLPTTALLTAYDANNNIICQVRHFPVPSAHSDFIGLGDPDGRIKSVLLDYGQTSLSESIDDLYFSPRPGMPPARRPEPTWTPLPTLMPTPGPSPTPTPLVPVMPYYSVVLLSAISPIFQPDFALHGI